jgi:hypothetical protein
VVSGRWLLALALALAGGGCSLLVPVDDLVGGVPPGDGGLPPDGTSCGDVQRDPNHCGACGHSCRGGECNQGRCQPQILARDQEGPLGIFVPPPTSPFANYVFWVTRTRPSLRRALKDGTGGQLALESTSDGVADPFDLVVDETSVWWSQGRVIKRKPLPAGMGKDEMGAGGGEARYLALDGSLVYISSFEPASRMGLIVTTQALYRTSFISGLAVSENVLYWIERDMQQVVKGTTAGGLPPTLVVMTGPMPAGLAVDDTHVYWFEGGRRLQRVPKGGGAQTTTVYEAPSAIGETDVGVDDQFIYWTESANGVVLRVAK